MDLIFKITPFTKYMTHCSCPHLVLVTSLIVIRLLLLAGSVAPHTICIILHLTMSTSSVSLILRTCCLFNTHAGLIV